MLIPIQRGKGLEYPIVIVADLFTDKLPTGDCIIDHAARRGWVKIGPFRAEGWTERVEAEARQQDAEGRRLLYVALGPLESGVKWPKRQRHDPVGRVPGRHEWPVARAASVGRELARRPRAIHIRTRRC